MPPTITRRIAAAVAALALTACSQADGDALDHGSAQGRQGSTWGDSPGIVVHTADLTALAVLDPRTGQELHRIDLVASPDLPTPAQAPDFGHDSPTEYMERSAFTDDFSHLAYLDRSGQAVLLRLAGQPEHAQVLGVFTPFEGGVASHLFGWMDFSSQGRELWIEQHDGDRSKIYSIPVDNVENHSLLAEGIARDELIRDLGDGSLTTSSAEHQASGSVGGDFFILEGREHGGRIYPDRLQLHRDGDADTAQASGEYFSFQPTGTNRYLGFDAGTGGGGLGPLVEFSLDDQGSLTQWREAVAQGGVDGYAISPVGGRIAVSMDQSVFLLSMDDASEQVRLDTEPGQDYQVAGWF